MLNLWAEHVLVRLTFPDDDNIFASCYSSQSSFTPRPFAFSAKECTRSASLYWTAFMQRQFKNILMECTRNTDSGQSGALLDILYEYCKQYWELHQYLYQSQLSATYYANTRIRCCSLKHHCVSVPVLSNLTTARHGVPLHQWSALKSIRPSLAF
jgi:hypothetical protein